MDSSEYVLALDSETSVVMKVNEKDEIISTLYQNMIENNLLLENFENLHSNKSNSDELSSYVFSKILVTKYQALETIELNEDYTEEINFEN
jgi:hypothetical protein